MATKASRILKAIIMGPPGSGKGTISERIVKDFGVKHLSSGDVLRKQILEKTAVGVQAQKFIEHGALVPDDVMTKLILSEMQSLKHENLLLDGFPRTVTQAESLHKEESFDVVINLNVPFDTIIGRISGRWVHAPSGRVYHTEFNPPKTPERDDETGEPLMQRDDDRPETVKLRLETYQKQTSPLLAFYQNMGLLEEFKGSYSNEIWPRVHKFLGEVKTPIQFTHYG